MKLVVQKEIEAGAVLQQDFIVEYIVASQMCDDCHRVEAKDYWRAVVQVGLLKLSSFTIDYVVMVLLFLSLFIVHQPDTSL